MNYKTLNRVETNKLLKRLATGDTSVREELILGHMALVIQLAHRLHKHNSLIMNKSTELDDLIQEGVIGLMRAIDTYKYTKYPNNTLSTRAVPYIRAYIKRAINNRYYASCVRYPVHIHSTLTIINTQENKLERSLTEQEIKEIIRRNMHNSKSINKDVYKLILELKKEYYGD